jgi:hypothetical protein
MKDRSVLAVYPREIHILPDDDRRRLRRLQVHYLEYWVHALAPLRTDLSDGELRVTVHGAIAAIQSTLFFHSGLADDTLATQLAEMAHACLGTTPADRTRATGLRPASPHGRRATASPASRTTDQQIDGIRTDHLERGDQAFFQRLLPGCLLASVGDVFAYCGDRCRVQVSRKSALSACCGAG